jgi:hypothetical protein
MNEDAPSGGPTPPLPPFPPTPPRRVHKATVIGLAVGALVLVGASVAITAMVVGDDDEPAAQASSSSTPSALSDPVEETEATPEETETETYNEDPGPDDFDLSLKTKREKCFGSAGCNVTVQPELAYNDVFLPDPDVTVSITYEIRGASNGPVTETIEATRQGDDLKYGASEIFVQTPSNGTKLTTEITDVMAY